MSHSDGARRWSLVELPIDRLAEVATIPSAFLVERILRVSAVDDGLGGIILTEEAVAEPWVKDYDAIPGHRPEDWARRFDVSRWGFIAATDGERIAGSSVVAFATPGLDTLAGQSDRAVLWDLRVRPDARSIGLGTRLFRSSVEWARARGCREVLVETQNINLPACRLYRKAGCTVRSIDRDAYAEHPEEVQLIWRIAP